MIIVRQRAGNALDLVHAGEECAQSALLDVDGHPPQMTLIAFASEGASKRRAVILIWLAFRLFLKHGRPTFVPE